jgi:hypothetical protein
VYGTGTDAEYELGPMRGGHNKDYRVRIGVQKLVEVEVYEV